VETVTISTDISDSQGPGGGPFQIRKCGTGTLQLSGNNTYSGQTILESGALSVSSLNCFTKGTGVASSSLGAPSDIESGEIVLGEEGKEGECALIYTGTGETSDRVMNLAGKKSTVTFNQSGAGLLKLISSLLISGYGEDKTLVLKGDTAGKGEIAGDIFDPHDRAGKARTSLTKTGSGTWTISGHNTYSGPTTVTQGTLAVATAESLGPKTDVAVARGSKIHLNFPGRAKVHGLACGSKVLAAGAYSAANNPEFISGAGTLIVEP
jgi:autotransporter-associated beta strand protein